MSELSSPRQGTRVSRRPWRALSWGLFAVVLLGWWFVLAPTQIRGPATFAIIDGHSMEPMLYTGDLAIARAQPSYAVGDLVMYHVDYGLVIHRIMSGSATTGWTTKGDNRTEVDPWIVKNDGIVGKFWFDVGAVGTALAWVNNNAIKFGSVCAALALLFYIPLRRRKIAPVLEGALLVATREPRRDGRSNAEYGVLALSAVASLVAIGLVGLLGASHQLATSRGLIALAALLWAGGFTVYFVYRLYDGRGVAEPSRSMYALSGRLHLVAEFPALDEEPQPVRSAIALRTLAEKYRLPILHRIDVDTAHHEFMLITVQHGVFLWAPQPAPATDTSVAGPGDRTGPSSGSGDGSDAGPGPRHAAPPPARQLGVLRLATVPVVWPRPGSAHVAGRHEAPTPVPTPVKPADIPHGPHVLQAPVPALP